MLREAKTKLQRFSRIPFACRTCLLENNLLLVSSFYKKLIIKKLIIF
jgi:hypothetical protein